MATSSRLDTLPTDGLKRLSRCLECPRRCGVNRLAGERGRCKAGAELEVGRAALHFWEEPPISGADGSGTVFFGHCSLGCVYCQNHRLAAGEAGRTVSIDEAAALMMDLQQQGALNVNMVTAAHYGPQVREAVRRARSMGLQLPVVWNTSGYETVDAVVANRGTVDVYLADFKYARSRTAVELSDAPDYPAVALAAIDAMLETVGPPVFDEYRGQRRMCGGVLIRHLMLPGREEESKEAVALLFGRYGNDVLYSLMNQYTPVLASRADAGERRASAVLSRHPELGERVSDDSYQRLLDFADDLGMDEYYWQDGEAAVESFIPEFE